jgi:hypothetical protein
MPRPLRLAGVIAATLALLAGTALTTLADAGGVRILDARLVALPASEVGQTTLGVPAGGLPWQLDHGSAQLFANGQLHLAVQGLVLAAGPSAGSNPIPEGQAIVTCAGMQVAESSKVDFSTTGNASVNERLELPASCLAPAVFFAGITPAGARWFAVSGW